jgi:serine/threonine protein kinase
VERPLWDRIQEIYYSTLPIGESERRTFVVTACDSDPFLVQEVTSLLEADKSSGDFLRFPVFELGLKIITSDSGNLTENSASSMSDPLIGSTIDGRYLVEKELGRGGIGAVYLARDLSLHNRPVVIKTLLPAALRTPYVVTKFRQEVEALCRIDHPGVVSVLSAGELPNGKLFIGMQYIKGMTLRSQIPSEGMDLERAASILKQVGAALDDVHEKGIFHRDLKPENIMLQTLTGGTEFVKIVDFGIAKVKDSVVAPSTINEAPVGTVLYMSPEQLRGEKVGAVSDIYSTALIAFEMLTGRRPFNPTSGPQLLEMHRAGVRVMPTDLRPSLPTEAQAIILRALSFEPKDRYQTASSFGDELWSALIGDRERPPRNTSRDEKTRASTLDDGKLSGSVLPPARNAGVVIEQMTNPDLRQWKPAFKWPLVVAASLLFVVGIAALARFYIFSSNQQAAASVSKPQRSFSYWLTVQKMRDGRNYQDPFQSSGQEIFESGYKFRLNVFSPEPGYLYVLNEGAPEADGTTLTMLYPTPSRNNAFVSSQPVHTNWNRFRGQPGTENMWIIWSASQVSELETAKTETFENDKGALTNANTIRAVKAFLAKHVEPKAESAKDTNAQQTHVRGTGEVVVKLAQLEHR